MAANIYPVVTLLPPLFHSWVIPHILKSYLPWLCLLPLVCLPFPNTCETLNFVLIILAVHWYQSLSFWEKLGTRTYQWNWNNQLLSKAHKQVKCFAWPPCLCNSSHFCIECNFYFSSSPHPRNLQIQPFSDSSKLVEQPGWLRPGVSIIGGGETGRPSILYLH